ncbi:MFS transporter [Pseudonocardia bannensis]|uniref:MFS transporter n=1 Tax=Pseudonocardia bannensis TaxID=630973 RepID=UPI0028B0242C|nr:MFS transporter [Pseudonocardia bannensis]
MRRAAAARAGLYAGAFLGPFGGGITVAMLPELGASFGISAATASVSVTAYLVPFAAVMLVSGTLGERWGRHRTVVVAYLVYAAASVLAALSTALPVFLAARAVQGLANGFTSPLLLAALASATAPDVLGRAVGWFGSLQAAGQTSAPLLGGVAAEVDWRYAFWGVALVALGLAAVGIPPEERPSGPDVPRPSLRSAWRGDVLRAGIVAALGWGCLSGLNFLVALRVEDAFGLGSGERGLLLTGLGVAGLFTARLIGGAADRIGPRRCVLIGGVLGGLLLIGIGLAPVVWVVAALWALAGVATQFVLVGVNTLVLRGSTTNPAGSMSVVQAVRFGGGALSPLLVTPIYHADPLTAFLLPAALLLVAVPVALPPGPTAAGRPAGDADA